MLHAAIAAVSHLMLKPLNMQASFIPSLSKPRINGRVVAERAFGIKMGEDGGGETNSLDAVALMR